MPRNVYQEFRDGLGSRFQDLVCPGCVRRKWHLGHELLREQPELWFRGEPADDRDVALINAVPMPWVDIGPQSYLKHIHHKIKDQPIKTTMWTVENDGICRSMIAQAGCRLSGFAKPTLPAPEWEHMMINVSIAGNISPWCDWGMLSGRSIKTHLLAGPPSICPTHPWDIMLLHDFHTNLATMDAIESISSRKYDVLLMKMCEDFDG
ncbi:hypothetical protein VPNG_07495 [Cytospora leucostoma]|uniref:Uncharacterized protein n=1 Tax=Cytospora leucostoma TaxID=1230097 RepID=A0A423WS43_9PEZI|nr:hypothetical protein VPNG_07495 [Cytospora leucostoma]